MPEMSFSEDELIEHPDEWDWAVVRINKDYKLDKLDAAGLLYDFSQHEYWRERNPDWEWPSAIWNEDGEMIAVPYHDYNYDDANSLTAMVVNAKSSVISRAWRMQSTTSKVLSGMTSEGILITATQK